MFILEWLNYAESIELDFRMKINNNDNSLLGYNKKT